MIQAAAMHGTAMLTANPNVSPAGGTLQTSETQAVFASTLIGSIPASGKDMLAGEPVNGGVSVAKSTQRTLASALTAAEAATSANAQAVDVSATAAPQGFSAGSLVKDSGKVATPTVIADSTLGDASLLQSASVIASQTASAASPVSSSTAKRGPVESALISTGQTGSATQLGQSSSPLVVAGTPINPAAVLPAVAAIASSVHSTPVAQTLSSEKSGEVQPAGVLNAASRTVLGGTSIVTVTGRQSEVQGASQVEAKSTLPASNPVASSAALQSAEPCLNTGAQQVFAAPSPALGVSLVSAGSTVVGALAVTTPSGLMKPAHGTDTVKQKDTATTDTSAQAAVAMPAVRTVEPSVPLTGTGASASPAATNTAPLVSELSVPAPPSSLPGMAPIIPASVSSIAMAATSSLSGVALSAGNIGAVAARQGVKKEAQTRPASAISSAAGQADSAGSANAATAAAVGVRTSAPMNAPPTPSGSASAVPPVSASAATVASMTSSPRAGALPTAPTAFGAPSRISGTASPITSSVDESGVSAAGPNIPAPGAFAAATGPTGTAQASPALNVVPSAIVTGQGAINSARLTGPVSAASANAPAATHGTPISVAGVSHPAAAESAAATTVPQAVDAAAPVQHSSAGSAAVFATGIPAAHTAPVAIVPAAPAPAIATSSNAVPVPAASASPVTAFASPSDHQTLVSTPNVLEVGVSSGTEGWLRIRAEMQPQSGEITASVMANSATAVDSLHRQLPAMTAYLAGEQVNVSSVIVERSGSGGVPAHDSFSAGANDAGTGGTGAGNLPGQSAQQNPGGSADDGASALSVASVPGALSDTWSTAQTTSLAGAVDDLPVAAFAASNGSWLNVRA